MKKFIIVSLIILIILSISFSIVYAKNTANTSTNTSSDKSTNSNTSNIEDLENSTKIESSQADINNPESESKNIKIKTSIGGKNFYVYLDDKEYESYQKNGFFYNTNKHFSNSNEMIEYLQENYKVQEIK